MHQALQTGRGNAREIVAKNRTELFVVAESCKWFPDLAKKLWPVKTAAAVHHITQEPERSCYAWVGGKNDPPARALLRLLDSDQGWRVLECAMRGSKQTWWRDCRVGYAAERARSGITKQLELDL